MVNCGSVLDTKTP